MSNETELLDFKLDGTLYEGTSAHSRLQKRAPDPAVVETLVNAVQFFRWPESRSVSARVVLHNGFALYGEYTPEPMHADNPQEFAYRAFQVAVKSFKEIHRYLRLTASNQYNVPTDIEQLV